MNRNRVALLAAAVLMAGCARKPPAAAPAAPAAPQITVVKPKMTPVRREVEQPGTVQPFEETALHANREGFVGSVADDPNKLERLKADPAWPRHDRFIDIDSRVKEGQLLATLRVPELAEELKQKEATLAQTMAEVVQAEKARQAAVATLSVSEQAVAESNAGVQKAEAEVRQWEAELAQAEKLVGEGVLDPLSREVARKKRDTARATEAEATAKAASALVAVVKAQADRGKAIADVGAAEARVMVAGAEVGRLKALLTYTRIEAPFPGVVTRRTVFPGDRVSGTIPLFRLARIDPVRVVVQVPEADAGLVAVGQDVSIALESAQGPKLTGKVRRTSWALEPGSRTLRTEVDLPNPDGKVRPGTYVLAKLTAELPAAWAVPGAAVGKVGDDAVIYLAEDGKAVRVTVQLLKGDDKVTQIRRYKRPGAADWTDVTGNESVAVPASALSDGQALP